jgi:aspartate carbamoyltransferase catalytic subunit
MTTARPAKKPIIRHIVSINDLANKEIEQIFEVAQAYLDELADKSLPYRIGRSTTLGAKSFSPPLYEPSTRTRLSFESNASSGRREHYQRRSEYKLGRQG